MNRNTTFSFTLVPSREQEQALRRHVGAARFAFNQCLRLVVNALESKQQADKSAEQTKVPWSGFDLINAFNAWKRSNEAGVDDKGPGLVWRAEVCQQVFEEAAVDLGRALEAFSAGRKGERQGKPPRFPRLKRPFDCGTKAREQPWRSALARGSRRGWCACRSSAASVCARARADCGEC